MEYAFSILTIALGVGMLLYALSLVKGNYDNIFRNWATNPPDKEKYAKEFGKIIAFIALAPIISGLLHLLIKNALISAVILGVLLIAFIVIGTQHMKKYL